MKKALLKTYLLTALAIFGLIFALSNTAYAHCQIPCGIYDDHARLKQNADEKHALALRKSIEDLAQYYPEHKP